MGCSRRRALGTLAALGALPLGFAPRVADADPVPIPSAPTTPTWADFELKDLTVGGDPRVAKRFLLLVPKHISRRKRVPLLVLLHGLGEAHDETLGVRAWIDRYGLGTAYERLRRPPVVRTHKRPDWTDARLTEVNDALTSRKFGGMAVACPFTPRVTKSPLGATKALDVYADWIATELLPRARKEAPLFDDAAHTAIDGCSMGGYIAIEVFARRPELFGRLGMVQSAFGAHRVPGYAERIGDAMNRAGNKPVSILTSTGDPFRDANKALGKALSDRGLDVTTRESPGPHDQPWLRETGTLEMLLWHDRPR